VATPANAPSWLISKASLQKTVDAIMAGFHWARTTAVYPSASVQGNDAVRQVFHSLYDLHTIDDDAWWQEDYIHQAVAWCAMAYPGSRWEGILDWLILNPIDRLKGTSGWCNSWPVYYKAAYGSALGNYHTSWAAAWGGEAARLHMTCTTPADLPKNCSPDYLGGLYAALALAIQAANKRLVAPAWLSDATACKATMVTAIRAAHAANTGWALSRKQGYA
jgi:hypothetical protein